MDENKKKENVYKYAGIILDRMIELYGKSQTRFAKDILGIEGPNISEARKTKQIPDIWFQKVTERFNVTREELCRAPQKVSVSLEQKWGDNASGNAGVNAEGCSMVNLNHGGAGHGITMQLTEREAMLIERLRTYGNQATWAKIESDLDRLEQVSG